MHVLLSRTNHDRIVVSNLCCATTASLPRSLFPITGHPFVDYSAYTTGTNNVWIFNTFTYRVMVSTETTDLIFFPCQENIFSTYLYIFDCIYFTIVVGIRFVAHWFGTVKRHSTMQIPLTQICLVTVLVTVLKSLTRSLSWRIARKYR